MTNLSIIIFIYVSIAKSSELCWIIYLDLVFLFGLGIFIASDEFEELVALDGMIGGGRGIFY